MPLAKEVKNKNRGSANAEYRQKEELSPPPGFSEEVLKEAIHFTDKEDNPAFVAFKSKCKFKLKLGAKGTGKSLPQAIETIYRFVNEDNFNSS